MTRPMTVTEKILAAHADLEEVSPGDLIKVRVDLALANDITAPLALKVFKEIGLETVFDREKVALIPDHFVPNKDIASAEQTKIMREFALKHDIKNFIEMGEGGVEHVILPEKGLVLPGDLVIGADSHTCTYGGIGAFSSGVGSTDLGAIMATGRTWLKVPSAIKVDFTGKLNKWVSGKDLILYILGILGVEGALYQTLEFTGEVIQGLSADQRLTMANMAIEGGAKNGIVEPDDITRSYIEGRSDREAVFYASDPDAEYERVIDIDVSEIEPQVAFPHSPDNVRSVSKAGDVKIDQVVIGSCTNGRLEDFQVAAEILKGRKAAKGLRLMILPGSAKVYMDAIKEGLIETFIEAGGIVGPPTCGPCLGGHMGVLAEKERAVATTNRNFLGRMGHPNSEVYLSSPAVAAASAVLGTIGSPEDL